MSELKEKIISILTEDSRLSVKSVATMCGVSNDDVEKAIVELEEDGVILKYSLVVDTNKLEKGVEALIEVKVTPERTKGFDAIAQEIYNFDEVKSVFLMSGGFDLAVFIEGRTLKEVAMFVSEKLSTMNCVVSTATHFILKRYKSNGVIFDGDASENRIAVHP